MAVPNLPTGAVEFTADGWMHLTFSDQGHSFDECERCTLLISEVLCFSPRGQDPYTVARLATSKGVPRMKSDAEGAPVELRGTESQEVRKAFSEPCG